MGAAMTDTSTAQERMWINDCDKCNGRWAGHVKPAHSNPTEYVRADLHAALLAERDAARANTEAAVKRALDAAAMVADANCPAPAGGPFSHTNTARVTATDIAAAIRALRDDPEAVRRIVEGGE